MAAGNFYIRKNSAETDAVPNAGTNLDVGWDTEHADEGSICAYTDPNLQLDTGLYLIIYNEYFDTANVTNNERIEIQGEIHVSGTGVVGGYGQDYIRKSSDDQECVVQGSMFLQVTSDNTDVFIRFYRTDNSTTGTVNRVAGAGGVTIIEMDDAAHNFGFVSASASEATSAATERTLTLNTSDKVDTGFSLASNQLTVTNAGRYLVHYEMDLSTTGTGREVVTGYLRNNGTTEITGTRGFCYVRGADGCQDGALSWIGIVDLAASDSIDVRWQCPTSATVTAAAGTGILQMWEIPSGADECIMEATTGDYNANADFAWDTLPHIDTGSFTATAGNSNIDVDQNDHLLVFATFAQSTDSSTQRAVPFITIENNEAAYDYICGGGYHRNSSTSAFSCGVAGLITSVKSGNSIEIHTTPDAATGSLANTKGQFSVLSLDSIWTYTYVFPPVVTDFNTTEKFNWGDTNLVITGDDLEALKGTGKVEIWSDIIGTIKTIQTVDTWANTSIQIDTVKGSLPDNTAVYLVVTTDGGLSSAALKLDVGVQSYEDEISNMIPAPNFYWTFQNTWLTVASGNAFNIASGGTPVFVTTEKLARGDSHSLEIASGDYVSPADITGMNLVAQTRRYMGGWIQLDSVSQILGVIYEEGAQVNNIAFLIGFGNNLMLQIADTSDDYVQCYVDKPLAVNRPYHIWFKFHASGFDSEVALYVDGVEQTRTNGNPWTATDLDAHSGNISIGHEGTEALQVGDSVGADNVDIVFASPNKCYYSHWASWHGVAFTESDVRDVLFEKGAPAAVIISGDTEANMQTDVDTYADTVRPNFPLAIKVERVTGGGDLELIFDNLTFDQECSIDIQWMGTTGETLTIVMENGSSVNSNKTSVPSGGTVTLVGAPAINITVKDASTGALIEDARVVIEADTGGDLTLGDDIVTGLTDVNGEITSNHRFTTDQPIVGWARTYTGTTKYQQGNLSGTITSSGFDGTIFLIEDG